MISLSLIGSCFSRLPRFFCWKPFSALNCCFFQVNGCLSYFDKVPDGFYLIHGMDPYVWIVCSDLQENARVPSIESLRAVDPSVVPSVEVILIDRRTDPSLKELQNRIRNLSPSCITTKEVVDQLAKLVCGHMGWVPETCCKGLRSITFCMFSPFYN